jgi:hypothetical protein
VTRARLRTPSALLPGALSAALWLLPRAAQACAVCGGGNRPAVARAYFFGAVVLSLLPLGAIAALALWLRRRARSLAASAGGPASAGAPTSARG